MRKASRRVRSIACALALCLVQGAFGAPAWAKVAAVGSLPAPVGGSAAAASAAGTTSSARNLSSRPPLLPTAGPAPAAAPSLSLVGAPALVPGLAAPSALRVAPNLARRDVHAPGLIPTTAPLPAIAAGAQSARLSPLSAAAAAKATAIQTGVRRAFAEKAEEALPAALLTPSVAARSAAADSDFGLHSAGHGLHSRSDDEAPEPPIPSQPNEPKKGKGWFGLGATVAALIGGLLIMQIGIEAQGVAMSELTEKAFGDFSIITQVAVFSSIGSMVGQQLSKPLSDRFGLTKTFYAAHVLRALSLGGMVLLLGTGMMPLPLMYIFYAFNGMVSGIAANAEGSLRKFLLAQHGVSQQQFRTWFQFLAETLAVPAPMLLGSLVTRLGAGWITALYPATILVALMLYFMLKVFPLDAARRIENLVAKAPPPANAAAKPAPAPAEAAGAWQKIKNAVKNVFTNMEKGKDFVFGNPVFKYSFLGAVIFDIMNVTIYRLISPGYGKLVAGSAGMSAVQGNLVGMFSLGGLLLAVVFVLLERRAKSREGNATDAERAAQERRSMLRWTLWGVPALALLSVMAFKLTLPFPPLMFLDVNWLPSTVLAAALIPFGFFQVAASIKLNSYFNEKLPDDSATVQNALAFSGTAMTALSIVLMLALKPLFGDLTA
ncbi:MAG: hypothetical protein HYZ74_08150, partial [Elusimicrobia bacterium]|nr:hypothetical protein [Elusimicrobiota bacterium]